MAVMFQGTFDDSGDHDDPEHNSASFGAYIGPKDAWDCFEINWQLVLDAFDVPYLHMRETKNPKGKFAHLLKDRPRMGELFTALANVIGQCSLIGYGSVVRVTRRSPKDWCMSARAAKSSRSTRSAGRTRGRRPYRALSAPLPQQWPTASCSFALIPSRQERCRLSMP
jgi:hypothetical protein